MFCNTTSFQLRRQNHVLQDEVITFILVSRNSLPSQNQEFLSSTSSLFSLHEQDNSQTRVEKATNTPFRSFTPRKTSDFTPSKQTAKKATRNTTSFPPGLPLLPERSSFPRTPHYPKCQVSDEAAGRRPRQSVLGLVIRASWTEGHEDEELRLVGADLAFAGGR